MGTPVNRRLWALAVLAFLAFLAFGGCTSLLGAKAEIRQKRKFIIDPVPLRLSLPLSERPYELRVQIGRFDINRFYERDQFIFRLSPEEIRDDRYNLWAVRPSEMITNAVANYLRGAGLFTDMRSEFLDVAPEFSITGTIDAIERYDSGDRWFARLDATIQLIDSEGKIFWQHRFDPSEIEVYASDMVVTVQGMREILRQNMLAAIRSLDRALLIRKVSAEGGDVSSLLIARNGTVAQATQTDTKEEIPRDTRTYIVVPGKLAPEED